MKLWIGVSAFCVIVMATVLVFAIRHKNIPVTEPNTEISASKVISVIQNQQTESGKVATDIHIIHLGKVDSEGLAFASFKVAGSLEYGSLLLSPSGYSMSTVSFGLDASRPIRQMITRGDGFEFITGRIFGYSSVKSVVIIFTNGTSVSAPVEKGYFWYEHKTDIRTTVHVKQVIGLTDAGNIVQNHNSQ